MAFFVAFPLSVLASDQWINVPTDQLRQTFDGTKIEHPRYKGVFRVVHQDEEVGWRSYNECLFLIIPFCTRHNITDHQVTDIYRVENRKALTRHETIRGALRGFVVGSGAGLLGMGVFGFKLVSLGIFLLSVLGIALLAGLASALYSRYLAKSIPPLFAEVRYYQTHTTHESYDPC